MTGPNEKLPDIVQGLGGLGETTTAADLVRQRGQNRKLKVISEKKLIEWIDSLLAQQLAGREDTFSDLEKKEMLAKTQEELARRIQRQKEAENENERLKREKEEALQALSNTQGSATDFETAINALRAKLDESERINSDLQQDNYELQDQLQEKIQLLSSTIAEKDRLHGTVRSQITRSSGLVEGVIGLDAAYYGSQHAEASPVAEDAGTEEAFYHDFEVAAAVIQTLAADLERLRGIVAEQAKKKADEGPQLLAADLALLEQLKSGSLHAVDVAQPVEGLVEALAGARDEAIALDTAVAAATGAAQPQAPSALVEGENPAESLAGATAVARELAAAMARDRKRIAVLAQMRDDADEARNAAEAECEQIRTAYEKLLSAVARRGSEAVSVPQAVTDAAAPAEARSEAAVAVVGQLADLGGRQERAAVLSQPLSAINRVLVSTGGLPAVQPAELDDEKSIAEGLATAIANLDQLLAEQRREIEAARTCDRALAEQVRELALARAKETAGAAGSSQLAASVERLDQVIASRDAGPEVMVAATQGVVSALAAQAAAAQAAARNETELARGEVTRSHQAQDRIAATVVAAARGDAVLAEHVAEIAMSVDAGEKPDPESIREAVVKLAERKRSLDAELAELRGQIRQTVEAKSAAEANQARLTTEIAELRALSQQTAEAKSSAEGDRTQLGQELAQANKLLDEIRQRAEQERQRADEARQHAEEADRALVRLNAELAAAKTEAEAKAQAERERTQALAATVTAAASNDPVLSAAFAPSPLSASKPATDRFTKARAADAPAPDLTPLPIHEAVARLAARKQVLAEESTRLAGERDALRLEAEQAKAQLATALAQLRQAQEADIRHTGEARALTAELEAAKARVEEAVRQGEAYRLELEAKAARISETAVLRAGLKAENAKLQSQIAEVQRESERLGAELAAATAATAAAQARAQVHLQQVKTLSASVVAAAQGDEALADSAADLALVAEQADGTTDVPIVDQLQEAVQQLVERKQALAAESVRLAAELATVTGERDAAVARAAAAVDENKETSENAREIIGVLTQKREALEKAGAELRARLDETQAKLSATAARAGTAETANRQLAEALAAVAATQTPDGTANLPAIDDARVDLELALSQLPAEGETGVQVAADLGLQLAESGKRLAEALVARHQAETQAISRTREGQRSLIGEVDRLTNELAGARTELEDSQAAARRHQAEVVAIRQEMADQAGALAAKVQEITANRSELLALRAELSVTSDRVRDQERRLAELRTQAAQSARQLDEQRQETAATLARAEAAEQNQLEIAQALRSLISSASLAGNDPDDLVTRAAAKLEMAKATGGEHLTGAGKAFVEAVRDRVGSLARELADVHAQLAGAKADEERTSKDLAQLRAAVVDREHQLAQLQAGLDQAQAQAREQQALVESERARAAKRDLELRQLQDQLRSAQADLDEGRARGETTSGHLGEEVARLREDFARAEAEALRLRSESHDLAARLEASDARAKRTREELTRSLEQRDKVIQDKDRQLDALADLNADAAGLKAEVTALGEKLRAANERLAQFESLTGQAAGQEGRSVDLVKELRRTQAERDALREARSRIEAELTDARSAADEATAVADRVRRELTTFQEEVARTLASMRRDKQAVESDKVRLDVENKGLKAKLRRYTEGSASSTRSRSGLPGSDTNPGR